MVTRLGTLDGELSYRPPSSRSGEHRPYVPHSWPKPEDSSAAASAMESGCRSSAVPSPPPEERPEERRACASMCCAQLPRPEVAAEARLLRPPPDAEEALHPERAEHAEQRLQRLQRRRTPRVRSLPSSPAQPTPPPPSKLSPSSASPPSSMPSSMPAGWRLLKWLPRLQTLVERSSALLRGCAGLLEKRLMTGPPQLERDVLLGLVGLGVRGV